MSTADYREEIAARAQRLLAIAEALGLVEVATLAEEILALLHDQAAEEAGPWIV